MAEPQSERPAMAAYGVDTPDWVGLPWSWANDRLIGGRNYWLVTASADGRPHALPVWGVWDESELRFAFSCAPGARKARNLAENPRAVITIDDTIECLSIEGHAAPVSSDRLDLWIDRYLAKYVPVQENLTADFIRQNLLFEFVPDRAFAVIEREDEFATHATRWRF